MKVKLLLFGEGVTIPKTSIGIGIGFISVFTDDIDGLIHGFTYASSDLGSLGYIFLETPYVDIGDLDSEREEIFSNLHGRVVTFEISPNMFAINGGIARISMTVSISDSGVLRESKIEFLAEGCTGVSIVSNALTFFAEMLQLEVKVAELDTDNIVSEEDVVAISDAAPAADTVVV